VPVLVARLEELDAINRLAIEQLLHLQLNRSKEIADRTGWQSLNASRAEALRLLQPMEDKLALSCAPLPQYSPDIWVNSMSTEEHQRRINDLKPVCYRGPESLAVNPFGLRQPTNP